MKTRKQRAAELLARLQRGPNLYHVPCGEEFTVEAAERGVLLWLETWVLPDVESLVPEVRALIKEQQS